LIDVFIRTFSLYHFVLHHLVLELWSVVLYVHDPKFIADSAKIRYTREE